MFDGVDGFSVGVPGGSELNQNWALNDEFDMSVTVQTLTCSKTPEPFGLYNLAHALLSLESVRLSAYPMKYFPKSD